MNPVPSNFVWPHIKDEVTNHSACTTIMTHT